MSSLKRLALGALRGAVLAAAFASLGACGNDLTKEIDDLAVEACKCPENDADCANKANEKIRTALEKADEPSKADAEKIMKSLEKAGDCIQKRRTTGT